MTQDLSPLVDAFAATRAELAAAAARVPVAARGVPFVGHWHLRHLMAHLIGWDRTNIEALESFQCGELPAFYAHYEPDWATYNAMLVRRYGREDWDETLSALEQSGADVLAALRRPDVLAGRLPGVVWQGRSVSIAGVLRAAIRDETEHRQQIEAFLHELGAGSAPDAHQESGAA